MSSAPTVRQRRDISETERVTNGNRPRDLALIVLMGLVSTASGKRSGLYPSNVQPESIVHGVPILATP